jgi:hypothetical protein
MLFSPSNPDVSTASFTKYTGLSFVDLIIDGQHWIAGLAVANLTC